MFAKKMIELHAKNYRLWSIDESWLSEGDHRKMKWRRRGETNYAPIKVIDPRIAIVVAISSDGLLYMACS